MPEDQKKERKILWISFISGIMFAVVELVMAIYSHSQSVLMDAVYDSTELIIIALTLIVMPLFHKPVSEKHPFGYTQLESIFVIIKGFMLMSVTLGLLTSSIEVALSGGNHIDGLLISSFQLVLGFLCFLIYIFLKKLNKKITSPTIEVEMCGWRLDVYYSGGMALAFFLSTFFDGTALEFLSPYFDQIVLVFIVIFMLPDNLKLLFRALRDIFLFSPEEETMERIKEISNEVLKPYNYTTEFFDVTRTGRRLWVVIYFSPEKELLSLSELNKATEKINKVLSKEFDNCIVELMVNTEKYAKPEVDFL